MVLNSELIGFRGELAALAAALIWAAASIVYQGVGRQIPPLVLNLLKGLIAIAFFILVLLLRGQIQSHLTVYHGGLLCLSGAIGIGFGDTVYFKALNHLGPRRTLLIESLAPPLAAILAMLLLQETLQYRAWLGILLTITGVTWVVIERTQNLPEFHRQSRQGVIYALLAALAQAVGAILSRAALVDTEIDPLWSALVRLLAGVTILLIGLGLRAQLTHEQGAKKIERSQSKLLAQLRSQRLIATLVITAFASTFLAIWLQQTALKYIPAGIAQSLTATSPLFVIPFSIAMGDPVSPRAILGVIVAIAGVWLLLYP
ncbi:MAG: DMT family transporter [Leptolyngbyaceae cyanobacterium]